MSKIENPTLFYTLTFYRKIPVLFGGGSRINRTQTNCKYTTSYLQFLISDNSVVTVMVQLPYDGTFIGVIQSAVELHL